MKFDTHPAADGFSVSVLDTGDRTMMLDWEASCGSDTLHGRICLGWLDRGQTIFVRTGFEPTKVSLFQVRDQTPGVHQPVISTISPGSFMIVMKVETKIVGRFDIFLSPSGNPGDTRAAATVPEGSSGAISIPASMRQAWTRMFIKKMEAGQSAASFSSVMLEFPNGSSFAALNHLIKPEHTLLRKEGRSCMVFPAGAPAYSYFNIGFQKR
jgi:hypothetical protein